MIGTSWSRSASLGACRDTARDTSLTSANRSGAPAASTQAEAERAFPGTPLLPDPDPDACGLPTTIVRVDGERTTVLRQGGLSL